MIRKFVTIYVFLFTMSLSLAVYAQDNKEKIIEKELRSIIQTRIDKIREKVE